MNTLVVGFDSAWTRHNAGAIVGALWDSSGTVQELGPPQRVSYLDAQLLIERWQKEYVPRRTIIMLDQPTIVTNSQGQRPVEHLVASPVSRRLGGVQPANTSRADMFGQEAPVWEFLASFGGAANPLVAAESDTQVYETYPVLALIALGWILPEERKGGRLPKYNPSRRKTFSLADWQYLSGRLAAACHDAGLSDASAWVTRAGTKPAPTKEDQDGVDACLCLLVALYFAQQRGCLMVGDPLSGYMVVPASVSLMQELEERCHATARPPAQWVRSV